jgi:hypothetical protein
MTIRPLNSQTSVNRESQEIQRSSTSWRWLGRIIHNLGILQPTDEEVISLIRNTNHSIGSILQVVKAIEQLAEDVLLRVEQNAIENGGEIADVVSFFADDIDEKLGDVIFSLEKLSEYNQLLALFTHVVQVLKEERSIMSQNVIKIKKRVLLGSLLVGVGVAIEQMKIFNSIQKINTNIVYLLGLNVIMKTASQ